jgi:hypothetical protein
MVDSVLQLVVAPALVGASTLAARRWGQRIGGSVSAFPAIVGPVLFIAAREHGPAFAARAASGTLLGLVALSGFALACGWAAALRAGWLVSLAAGWAIAAGIAGLLTGVEAGPVLGLAAASVSLLVAHRALPRGARPTRGGGPAPAWDLPLRLVLTAVLVVSLSAAAGALGPAMGGVLAALPVLASILAAFTHRQEGAVAVVALLRGMLAGMAGFVVFCIAVAGLVEPMGTGPAFAAAALAAIAVHAAAAHGPARAAAGYEPV